MWGTFGEHIYSECDGSGYIISVFPDSQDHLRGVLGGKNLYMLLKIDFNQKKLIFSWIPSRQDPDKCVLRKYVMSFYHISIFGGSLVFWIRLSRNSGSIMYVIKNIILIRRLKISKQLFRKWKIKIFDLMFHIMFMGVGSVYPTCVTIKTDVENI